MSYPRVYKSKGSSPIVAGGVLAPRLGSAFHGVKFSLLILARPGRRTSWDSLGFLILPFLSSAARFAPCAPEMVMPDIFDILPPVASRLARGLGAAGASWSSFCKGSTD
eukprot:2786500-Pyramimonas_sp.AAC.1